MVESIFALIVLLLAACVVFIMLLSLHWGHRKEVGLMHYIVYPVMIAAAVAVLTSGRNISGDNEFTAALQFKSAAGVWLGRLSSVFVIFACGERLLKRIFAHGEQAPFPKMLMLGVWVMFLTNIISPAVLGRYPSISHEYMYMLLAGTAAMFLGKAECDRSVIAMRNVLLLFLVVSAACLAVKPDLVLSRNYAGLLPFLKIRYAGLSSHANGLGPLTVVLMMCLWHIPFKNRSVNYFAWGLALVSLGLTQSKTSVIAAILCWLSVFYFSYEAQIKARLRDTRQPEVPVLVLLLMTLGSGLIGFVVMFGNLGEKFAHFFVSRAGSDLMSLTGRDQIWAVALEEWHKHPIFGYGLKIWDEAFRLSVNMPYATHAHSQFYQSLSSAGTLGCIGLVWYVGTLIFFSVRTARSSGGLSLALLVLILCRSLGEVPLSMTGFAAEAVVHLLLLTVIAAHYVPRAARKPSTFRGYALATQKGWA